MEEKKDFESQRWLMTSGKQCLPDTAGQMYTGTRRDCSNMHKTCTDSRSQIGSGTEKGKWGVGYGPEKRENLFSSVECP